MIKADDSRKLCFVPCPDDQVEQGRCSCANRVREINFQDDDTDTDYPY